MTLNPVNPIEIQQRGEQRPSGRTGQAKAISNDTFGDVMGGVSAMNPFMTEFTRQSTGSVNAATVLNAAFTSFPAAAASFSGSAPSWGMAQGYAPTMPYWGAGSQGLPGLGASYPSEGMVSGGQAVPGTNLSQFQLMEIMNQNNLKLIELQAMMQSNMQVWNTKSNILSADHRAKMSMIEKFTARG